MLVKNENEWCWVIDGCVGYPEKSIEDCVNDFAKTYPAKDEMLSDVKVQTNLMEFAE